MIILRKKEKVNRYHMQLVLEKKETNPPFLSVLMLAREKGGQITPQMVQSYLMPSLPLRACENLLNRLRELSYLNSDFSLTEKGYKSAETRTFWVRERGAYVVDLLDSNLITNLTGQKIMKITPLRDSRSPKKELHSTKEIIEDHLKKDILLLDKEGNHETVRIIHFEENSLLVDHVNVDMEIKVDKEDAILIIKNSKKDNQASENEGQKQYGQPSEHIIARFSVDLREETIREELLEKKFGTSYDKGRRVVFSPFDPNNLALIRDVKIEKPNFRDNIFEPVTLENIRFVPSDLEQARQWMETWLLRYTDRYLWSEEDFQEYVRQRLGLILEFYPTLKEITREDLIQKFSNQDNGFYFAAKLETANYLTY